ncbi:MAG TPA: glycoside hydrolase family 5 protein [Xanthobacteraceae bacterium]|nr:glycoside hydrolase family 5 protein [Xanthobacteraceae bacterium]
MRQATAIAIGLGIFAAAVVVAAQSPERKRYVQLTGVNLSGGEFSPEMVPGRFGMHYTYPTPQSIEYFAGKGMNVSRLPVLWERIQQQLTAELYEPEMHRIDEVVNYATSKGMKVIIDVHNYGAYRGSAIGSENLPVSAFGDLWRRLATRYGTNDAVIFGLMHAPTGLATERWLEAANRAIAEIRSTRAQNLLLIPGNGWTSARDWTSSHYGTPNARVMLGVADPLDNYMYEVHQYFDEKFSGSSAECGSVDTAVETLKPFTEWARQHRKRGFLGQFGVGANNNCLDVLNRVLAFMANNNDVWHGWTYWAAGEWWPRDFFSSVQPVGGEDRPQMSVLSQYIKRPVVRLDGSE